MCEISNRNFIDKYPEIFKEITASDFISIDCEFSGLSRHKKYEASLFDNPSQIYEKIRRGNQDFIALQIGITSFTYNRDEKYEAMTYTFHLLPRPYSSTDACFLCDSRSIQFLCDQNFDFNKVFHDGITYMNASNETQFRKEIDDGSFVARMRGQLDYDEQRSMRSFCSKVTDWLVNAAYGDSINLNVTDIESFNIHLIREEIETNCPQVCTYPPKNGFIRVEKTSAKQNRDHRDELFALVLGFTRLIKEIIAMKKPIIGHNMFTDLVVIYKMFIAPLPNSYENFKKELTKVFPDIYDTKYLSIQLKKMTGRKDLWTMSILFNLYKFFKDEKGASYVLGMPIVKYKSVEETPQYEHHHNSGFDSYCTGFVFLKLAHMFSMWDPTEKTFKRVSLGNGPVRYFGGVKGLRNKINLMRGNVHYISLDGPDPKSERPDLILIESLSGSIDLLKISSMIYKYDNADIKQLTKRRVLIASTNELSSKMLFKEFAKDKSFRLTKYKTDTRMYNTFSKSAIVITLIGGIGIVTFLLYKNINGIKNFWESTRKVNN